MVVDGIKLKHIEAPKLQYRFEVMLKSSSPRWSGHPVGVQKTNEPIEIPPPRPKKKPLHPYPRKSVDSPNGISAANQSERSPSPNSLVANPNRARLKMSSCSDFRSCFWFWF